MRGTLKRKNTLILSVLFLIPVMIISVVNFGILYQRNVSAMENDLKAASEQKLELMRSQMVSMHKLVSQQRLDKDFSTQRLLQSNPSEMYFAITKTLSKPSVWSSFFSSISYYNREANLVYTTNTVKTAIEFFGEPTSITEPVGGYSASLLKLRPDDLTDLAQLGNHVRSMRVRNLDGGRGVMFAMPLELKEGAPPTSYLLFTVSDKTLSNLWGMKEGVTCLLLYNDVPIYSSNVTIKQSLDEGKGVNEAGATLGEITFSYKMNGITVHWFVEKSTLMKSLVSTIFLGMIVTFGVMSISLILVLHYSRKSYEPIHKILQRLPLPALSVQETAIDEFKYINFVLDDLMDSNRSLEKYSKELRREKYLYHILVNEMKPDTELFEHCLSEGIRVDRRWFACLIVDESEENYDLFEKLTDDDGRGPEDTDIYSIYIGEDKYIFLVASDLPKDRLEEWLSSVTGHSRIVEGVSQVRNAYESAIYPRDETAGATELRQKYPMLELQALQEAVDNEDQEKLTFLLSMIKNAMDSYNETMRGAILMAVCTILSQGDAKKAIHFIVDVPSPDVASVHNAMDVLLNRYKQREEDRPISSGRTLPRNLRNILKYIEENYTSPNFSIKAMASDFGTSPSNLSHQFKKATGKTLSRIIDEMRMKKAEELLAAGEQVNAVAQKLGYSTTPVFTEKFKRYRGITPSVYRNHHQLQD